MQYQLPLGFKLAVANADFRSKQLPRNDLSLLLCDDNAVATGLFHYKRF